MIDSARHKSMRKKMVEELRELGISSQDVLRALYNVPRHLFLDKDHANAYENYSLPIQAGQTISRPYTVAFQTESLNLQKGHKVLEIGTGSGYQSAVLIELGAMLYTVERQEQLFQKAKKTLPLLKYIPLALILGDGNLGLPQNAPFDRILVTAAAEKIPENLKNQLAINGRMIIPVGKEKQIMTCIDRLSENEFKITEISDFEFDFVPLLEGVNRI